jgi:murein DD-endopeptidase MepM/ murein hydrolase activator NlpD
MRRRKLGRKLLGGLVGVALLWSARGVFAGEQLPIATALVVSQAWNTYADTLQRNETLSDLLARHNIVGQELYDVLQAAEEIDPRRLRAGQVFELRYAVNERAPDQISVRLGDSSLLRVIRDTTMGWRGESKEIYWTVTTQIARGEILSSLYETVDDLIPNAVLPPGERARLVWDLADGVFGWVIDFARDNYSGDDFQIVYERLSSELGDVRFGRILAAKVETRGSANSAYVMTDVDGRNAYYDAEGKSLKRAFKLYPAEFRRISSGFSHSRFHPVYRTNRPHLGVDYAADAGTPIVATGDGTVVRAGRWGTYGLIVTIRHARGIETRYAHMSRIASGIRAGVRVQQGQRIGYVGMTGTATGPHLHYEFIQNGRHIDPRQAARFGKGDPVPDSRRAEFDSLRSYYDGLLAPRTIAAATAGLD